MRGLGLWPAIAAAAFAVNATTGIPLWSAAIIAAGNTLEAVAGAAFLKRAGFDSRLERLRDVYLLVGVAALGSTTISATFGLLAALLGHVRTADGYAAFWAVWWVGDSLGDLLIAPSSSPGQARRGSRAARCAGWRGPCWPCSSCW